jgi:hypothetical protein
MAKMMTRSVNAAVASVNAYICNMLTVEQVAATYAEGIDCPFSGDDLAKFKARQKGN